ncbi:MAG: hypothetical protein D3917_19360 [Candidatus Electrothrix sp. AX5]|jgi:hypothetical protein|uniref:Lipoprotein n=1 Tax=Candidatus Electrothrix aarhusensis TaxID=1859131 RepID=A0A3S3QC11_9BACT|nr:hypothetical protein [Candidatus Electrothrix sp. AX5]RWX43417.1 hypothetical protein H206_03121 [Candidatus Electrothrix aarhusensis]
MKKHSLLLLAAIPALLMIGCSKEEFYEGMYRGLQQREERVHPAAAPFPPEQPSYDDYRREREEALRNDDE